MDYNEKEIRDMFLATRPYQKECLDFRGKTSEGVRYNEILAQIVLKDSFNVMPYSYKKHDLGLEKHTRFEISTFSERGLSRVFVKENSFFDDNISKILGIPVEYDINVVEGTKINVDLVSVNPFNRSVYLIEVKGNKGEIKYKYTTNETLLKCLLEIETYYESLVQDKDDVLNQIFENRKDVLLKNGIKSLEGYSLKKALLLPNDSIPFKQKNNEEYPLVNKVINKYEVIVLPYKSDISLGD